MKHIVDRFNLSKWLGQEEARLKLVQAGYRGQAPYITYLFFRLVTPAVMLVVSLLYLFVILNVDQPPLLKVAAAIFAAYFGMPGGELIGRGYMRPGAGLGSTFPLFWETGMGGAEIKVDFDTGEIQLEKYVTVADVGTAINPQQAEGQDEGAAIQGLGHTLFESLVYEQGQPLNANLVDYRVPRFTDLPRQFDSVLIENRDGPGPYGAKGMGESGIVSVAPAVGNALCNATGVRIRALPLTPERVWRALRDHQGHG